MVKLSDSKSDNQCMKNMNERLSKQINMHVGEAVRWLGNIHAKQFHACDSSDITTKVETELG